MHRCPAFLAVSTLLLAFPSLHAQSADAEGITWLLQYDGAALPDAATWKTQGTVNAKIDAGALHLADDSAGFGNYRATWKAALDQEIVVEATVKVGAVTGSQKNKPATSLWPWRDGAPIALQVSDGRHQDGLVLFPAQATSFTDRFIPMDTTNRSHTYRLVIRGTDMSMWVDGVQKVEGQNAFWKPADSPEPFLQFGSTAKTATGDAHWSSVKLGVRKLAATPKPDPVKITIGLPWQIPRAEVKQTRPYLYDMGRGLLLMSVAQGPDALYEPYGLLKSTDAGKTWVPIAGLDQVETAPLPILRRTDGTILGASRWTWSQPDGSLVGKTVHLDADATKFTMFDSQIVLPAEHMPAKRGDVLIFERHIFQDHAGGITAVVWSRKSMPLPDGRKDTIRLSHLVRSTDEGRTWNYVSTIGPGGEPAVARISATEMTAVIRGAKNSQMTQVFSHDGGKTWDKPIPLEVGKVAPDLVLMSNGVLACSYGRPASCVMFSIDGGRTWPSHHIVSARVGFNYTSIREVSPGRLLFTHDAPKLSGVYIDVERNN
jgi:hypothetical protein